MLPVPPLSAIALSSLDSWHDQQQPLVRALATPMVDEVRSALTSLQTVVDEREADITVLTGELNSFYERVESLEKESHIGRKASQAVITDLVAKLQATTDRIDVMERQLYGKKSERKGKGGKTPDPTRAAQKRRRKELTAEEKQARRQAAEAQRKARLDALRTVTHTVTLSTSFDGIRSMPPVCSVVYEWHPGELVRVEVTREQGALPDGCIVTAPPVAQVVEGGIYGPALYAKVASDKCLNAMPLRRQERAFSRLRAPLPASTLCALFHRAGELIVPIYEALHVHVAASPHINADETPLPILDENATRKGWMWVFATSDALLFKHSPSRGKAIPQAVLGASTGTLTVDGYTAYNSVTGDLGRRRGGCWCHARRGLYDVLEYDEAFVKPLLDQIGELFYVETLTAEQGIVGTSEHLALREKKSKPVIQRLFQTLDAYDADAVDARSSVSKAVRYILNQREPLQLFLSDAAVPIHNNLSERALRVIALMRKNALFAGNGDAAQRFAQLLSLLATCQMHEVDPEAWLADVLLAISEPGLIASDLLPWNWKVTRGLTYRPYYDTT